MAAPFNPLLIVGAGKRGLHDIRRGGCGVVFRAQGDQRARAMQHVANELECGGAHRTLRIDAQSNVVDFFSAMDRFRNHELLVLGPRKAGRNTLRCAGSFGRLRRNFEQAPDQDAKRLSGGGFHPPLIGGEQGLESVGGGEHRLSEQAAVRFADFG